MKNFVLPVFIGMMLMSCSTTDKEPRSSDGDFSNQLTPEEIEKAVFTPEILWKFGRVGDMQLSPDGSTVLYTVTRYDAKTDKSHTWIFSVNVAGGEPINLTEGIKESCSGPRWINNVHIAFLRKKDDRTKIWSMNADGTDVQILSDFDVDINAFGFAPDGVNLFYTRDVKLDSTVQDRYPDLPLARGMVFEDMMYRHWDSWHDYSYNHIFVSRLENGKIQPGKDIMQDEPFDSPLPPYFNTDEISWNHDGTKLAYTCKKLKGRAFSESTNSDIYIYDVNGNTRNITEGMPGYERYPVFSPDGNMVAFMSMETPGYEADQERLFIYDLTDNTKKYLTEKLDQDAAHFVWTKEGDKIYFISGLKATYQIFECNPVTGETRQVTTGTHNYTNLALHNGIMTATKGNMTMPPEVYSVDPATGKDIQLTFTNRNIYDVIRTGNIEERWIKTTDGKDMLVWVIFPPDFDPKKKYPALLYCQGGPQSAVSQNFSYRWNFQLMAANGYIIVAPNRRGLPTFGREWNAQISGDYGGQNISDYLSAIDAVKKEPWVDAERLGAVGASYGGYSVLYLAGHHEKRFKAFIAHCGMFNLESQAAATEEMFFVHHDLGGYYWDKPKPVSYAKFSPHLYVDKWDTPIMLISGMNDFRIPYTESLQAFNVAQLRGIPSKLLIYPDENHWVTKPQNSILWQREFFGWLDKWLK